MSIYWPVVEVYVHVATGRRASIGTVVEVYVHVATAECTSAVGHWCTCMDDASTASAWVAQLKKKNNYLFKRCMELLANQVRIQGMEVLLAGKVHKQEPQHINGYISHNHPYICSSGMTDVTVLLLVGMVV